MSEFFADSKSESNYLIQVKIPHIFSCPSALILELTTNCQAAFQFADDYAYLCGKKLEEMENLDSIGGSTTCDRLRTDLSQLLEDRVFIESELNSLRVNQDRAVEFLKKFGFT